MHSIAAGVYIEWLSRADRVYIECRQRITVRRAPGRPTGRSSPHTKGEKPKVVSAEPHRCMVETSQALVMEEPGELAVHELDVPELGPKDTLVRVELSGICGSDVHMFEGGMDLDFPVLPGHEIGRAHV